ncbi:glycosyl hydrolase family 18 protein [Paenibacillus senegalensis]|uniref:glycosyl hydrolase family 18 protein n=1 Tax=Paenibacillus senegalensis TaxID=1465766 RepID=UPI0002F2F885|nr:glycosyl hydrolase family 18 protein [Paenibacillus senegalensis]
MFILLAAGSSAFVYWLLYWPNSEKIEAEWEAEKPVFYKGVHYEPTAIGSEEGLKLPFSFLQEWVDPDMIFDEASESVIITTWNKVVQLKTSELTAMVNDKPMELLFSVTRENDQIWVPVEPLMDLYNLHIRESAETGAIIVHREGDIVQWGQVIGRKARALRSEPTVKAPLYTEVDVHERVMIWGEEEEGWYYVQLPNGLTGYMNKKEVAMGETEVFPIEEPPAVTEPWKPVDGKINLTWQQVYNRHPDTDSISPMPGVNVISPQWFHLENEEGRLINKGSAEFAKWASNQGYQVWALVTNSFDPELTSQALSTYERRMYMIKQLVTYAQMYNIQGINVDFENVYLEDKEMMVQFMRELSPILREQGLVVSIDVTIKGGSPTYSLFMDREAIAPLVDYMAVMTYDEHWGSSPVAGSVASLPWVEDGIARIIEEDGVPPSKLLLGVPFYTRIWTEEVVDGQTKVSSRAVSMQRVNDLLAEKSLIPEFDEETGQHYVEFIEDGKTNKIWIEDAVSMKSRIELINKYDLGGVASWSRGFETPDIWEVIRDNMEP